MHGDQPLLAKYANWFNIGHNNFEFILDFGQFHSHEDNSVVHTRIVVGPAYAKVFAKLLGESLGNYESEFGAIPDAGEQGK